MKTTLKGNIFLWLTAIIWGAAFVAQKVGGDYVGAFTFNAIRFALGSLSLIPVFLIFEKNTGDKKRKLRTMLIGAACGILLFAASSLQQIAIGIGGSAGKAGFLTGLYTVIVPIIGVFMGKKSTVFTWLGVGFAIAGLYLISFEGSLSISLGDILLILCALMFAVQIVVVDKYISGLNPLHFAFWQFVATSALSFGCALIFETIEFSAIKSAGVAILYGGFGSVGIAYTLQILGQKESEPTYASIVMSTEAVFAAICGILLLNETMAPKGYVGCFLIFAGIVLSQLKGKKNHDTKIRES